MSGAVQYYTALSIELKENIDFVIWRF